MKSTFRSWISGFEESLDISSALMLRFSPVRALIMI